MKLCKDCKYYELNWPDDSSLDNCHRKDIVSSNSLVRGTDQINTRKVNLWCDMERSLLYGLFGCGPWGRHYEEKPQELKIKITEKPWEKISDPGVRQ